MALDVECGSFSKVTTGGDGETQNVSMGFDPKAIIFWGTHNRTAVGQTGDHAELSLGFTDGANHRSISGTLEDAVTNENVQTTTNNANCIYFRNIAGTDGPDVSLGSCAFGTNQFTITWNLQDSVATQIFFIAYGGADITGVEVGDFNKSGSLGIQSVTFTSADVKGITDDQGIIFEFNNRVVFGTSGNNLGMFVGMATSASHQTEFGQGVDGGAGLGEPRDVSTNNLMTRSWDPTGGAARDDANFDSWDSDGFNLEWNDISGTAPISYLVIKGGQWQVGTDVTPTATGTKAFTTLFQPKGVFIATNKATLNGTIVLHDMSLDFSATDGTNEVASTVTDEEGVTTIAIGTSGSTTKVVMTLDQSGGGAPTIDGEADFDSFNALDFTLDWTNAPISAFKMHWIACGDSPGGLALVKVAPDTKTVIS